MTIKIRDVKETCIIDIFDKKISELVLHQIKEILISHDNEKRIALNFMNIEDVDNKFLDFAQNSKIKFSMFNLHCNICILLFILNFDKTCSLYISENDFVTNKRRIVNRHLKLCS